MNAKITPWVIVAAILIATLYGPFSQLSSVTKDNLTSSDYWLGIGAATLQSFASGVLAMIGIVAGALGLPVIKGLVTTAETPNGEAAGKGSPNV